MQMIEMKSGDLFRSPAQTLVNTVNLVGVMGRGIALEFRKQFPDMYSDYVERCARRQLRMGEPYVYVRSESPWILNFPTKAHWRSNSALSDIVAGLDHLEHHYRDWGVESLAVPPLGCGNGGLDWRVVGPTIRRHLERLAIPVEIYEPAGLELDRRDPTPGVAPAVRTRPSLVSHPRGLAPAEIALAEIVRLVSIVKDRQFVELSAVQVAVQSAVSKGVPLLQESDDARLTNRASMLKSILVRLANNGVLCSEQHNDVFLISVGPTFSDATQSNGAFLQKWGAIMCGGVNGTPPHA
ncbi:MAG: Appr-1-p processing protein [Chloroflexota bacterium]|nr:MAG: Appr-1-p processing protein [Chloroflexota bacterium]